MEKALAERLPGLPTSPGVYIFKDSRGLVLYVGKAASLRHRVRSYFGAPVALPPKLQRMVSRVADLEVIVTDSEQEALLLENNLIKKYRPRYNSRLKDDKNYPYLKVDVQSPWPTVAITRRVEKDGARYFGPFASASSVRKTLDLLKRLFPYCPRPRLISRSKPRPCLDYHMHRCLGACIGAISQEEYRRIIDQVLLFLEGKQERVLDDLRERMEKASEALQFELASYYRDQLYAVERVMEHQKVVSPALEDEDVIALAAERDQAVVQVFFIRTGKVLGREQFIMEGVQDEEPAQILGSFVKLFYPSVPFIPPRILLQYPLEDRPVIQQWLKGLRGGRVELVAPREGDKAELVRMVAENARQGLEEHKGKWLAEADLGAALEELQRQLALPQFPRRIECYDISTIQGIAPVGSMVVFEDGRPRPALYRRFRIRSVEGMDDYAMLREVLRRRLRRRQEEDAWAALPDLLLVDGGKGQLGVAVEAVREAGLESLAVASLAKEEEAVFLPGREDGLLLPRSSPALHILQRVRDEAHRFALAYHLRVRSKKGMASAMDAIPGLGPKRKKALLRRFGSLQGMKEAPVEELAAIPGITRSLAQRIKSAL